MIEITVAVQLGDTTMGPFAQASKTEGVIFTPNSTPDDDFDIMAGRLRTMIGEIEAAALEQVKQAREHIRED